MSILRTHRVMDEMKREHTKDRLLHRCNEKRASGGGGGPAGKSGTGKALEDLLASPGLGSSGVSASLTGTQAYLQGRTDAKDAVPSRPWRTSRRPPATTPRP